MSRLSIKKRFLVYARKIKCKLYDCVLDTNLKGMQIFAHYAVAFMCIMWYRFISIYYPWDTSNKMKKYVDYKNLFFCVDLILTT